MKKTLVRFLLALKATRELGAGQTFWYSVYQAGLRSGFYRRATPIEKYTPRSTAFHPPFTLPEQETLANVLGEHAASVIAEADEVAGGKIRLFGGPLAPLLLVPPDHRRHWTDYEVRPANWGVEDIKLLWEPARFGWVYPLGRAYTLTCDEKYPAAFWQFFETFLEANPPNQGPNWASAQEVALRLMALLFAAQVFEHSPHSTAKRMAGLAGAAAAHAQRIPPTLSYARAQNNNHRVSEALGLYAAGCALTDHPQARRWREAGWQELNRALQSQIRPDGTYTQHSMNYHRLMLHAALQARSFGRELPQATAKRLAAAATWLLAQVDPVSGGAPNLGSNDGAHILPLAAGGYADYRPVAQAAARAFLGRPAFPPGAWNELGLWLGQPVHEPGPLLPPHPAAAERSSTELRSVHRLKDSESWATLRAVRFTGRPSQADQLHVDLWWRGENVAMDAGTFRYTAPSPWNNTLAETFVHNTVEVNGQNQMLRAGRFLWLDWAQAALLNTKSFAAEAIAAQHSGYRRLGVLHRRILKHAGPGRWQVIDYLLRGQALRLDARSSPVYTYRLHWLLPDWPWALDGSTLTLTRPAGGRLRLTLTPEISNSPLFRVEPCSLARAGQALAGPKNVSPISGWFSPTYNVKIPALSFSIRVHSPLPFTIGSDWVLE